MCRATLSNKINDMTLHVVNFVKEQIKASIAVCTTADIWSCLKKSYMGVTAHGINDDLTRVLVALACRRFRGSHTYDAITKQLVNIHTDFGLDHHNVSFTVTDNGSNFVKAFAEFQAQDIAEMAEVEEIDVDDAEGDEEDGEADDTIGNEEIVDMTDVDHILLAPYNRHLEVKDNYLPKHMRCASHTFNLIATADVTQIIRNTTNNYKRLYRSAMGKCSRLWTNVSRSTKSSDIVESLAKVSLRAPGETRWNATYDVIKHLLEPRVHVKLPQIMEALNM